MLKVMTMETPNPPETPVQTVPPVPAIPPVQPVINEESKSEPEVKDTTEPTPIIDEPEKKPKKAAKKSKGETSRKPKSRVAKKYKANELKLVKVRALRKWVEEIYSKKKKYHISPEFREQFQLIVKLMLDECFERMKKDKRTTLMQKDALIIYKAKIDTAKVPKHIRDALEPQN
jgi:type IV secretory pathway VirB10-like protein